MIGRSFTWSNRRRGDELIQERLDQFLVEVDWQQLYPNATVLRLLESGLDHSPLLLDSNHGGDIISEIEDKLKKALQNEESYWKDKSRVKWLKSDDQNTTFFHHKFRNRTRRNKIWQLTGSDGEVATSNAGIASVAESYFKDIFSSTCHENPEPLFTDFEPKVTAHMNHRLLGPVTMEEVKRATFNIHPQSAPGDNGHISAISSHSLQYLDLCRNKLQGNVPKSMFNLVNLTELCLSSKWSGSLYFSLFSKLQNLKALSLSGFNSLLLASETNVSYQFTNLLSLQLLQVDLTNISKILWKFPKLQTLVLSENKLEGNVPKWIHDIHSLERLKLSQNQLSSIGQFPWYQLKYLDLFNLLTDDNISFICNATSLQIVNLSHNKFKDTIPQCLANSPDLQDLDLPMNKFHGTLPSTFSRDLISLNPNGNQLEGHLPRSLSNCKDLIDLNLGNNQIEDTFPNWLQSLPYLEILVLQSNKLYGPIVSLKTKDMFPHLLIFDISSNHFSGQLPKVYIKSFQAMKSVVGVQTSFYYIKSSYVFITKEIEIEYHESMTATMKGLRTNFEKIPEFLVSIDLSSNRFEGEIPDDFGELHRLIGLNLSHNNLNGPVPHSLGNLSNLESLDLSSNMLTGKIPDELTNLISLEVLNLSSNHLEGTIPRGKQFDTFSNDSYEENMGLCGFPLSIQCNNNVPQQQYPSSEAEDKFGFGWKPVAIGYACGMVFGIGLGCCVFLNWKTSMACDHLWRQKN
ncbi:receptor-like protein 9DC3 [Arachis stenosperma]|uniref:receptor-like protein 9DC3 n=1 Tax=Arachis stenosperma TaxID=217475 RepID=UPI0025AC4A2F|nr:receptor-like protein 9DC3 [Arachis stenosperma]